MLLLEGKYYKYSICNYKLKIIDNDKKVLYNCEMDYIVELCEVDIYMEYNCCGI